uniref:Uncharacterized protein n=1 Tax=Glossina austeni TaxID=7395 RepID=A0A1A9UZL5_GLOAU
MIGGREKPLTFSLTFSSDKRTGRVERDKIRRSSAELLIQIIYRNTQKKKNAKFGHIYVCGVSTYTTVLLPMSLGFLRENKLNLDVVRETHSKTFWQAAQVWATKK